MTRRCVSAHVADVCTLVGFGYEHVHDACQVAEPPARDVKPGKACTQDTLAVLDLVLYPPSTDHKPVHSLDLQLF